MAELNTNDGGGKDKKVRSKKAQNSVDLAAMVDLAFLLITFFMLTTTLMKAQSMSLAMPAKDNDKEAIDTETKVPETRTVTLLLGEDNKLVWYLGLVDNPLDGPTVTTYGKDGIRPVLLEKNRLALQHSQDEEKGLIVIIKPSDKSTYKDLVDALDEMAITHTKVYAIVDMTDADLQLLINEGLYTKDEDKTDEL